MFYYLAFAAKNVPKGRFKDEMLDPGIWVFMEKLNDMIKIYGRTEAICFDKNNIYLIAG